ncbi:hypothetical protein HJG60_007963 [Phyllostomus discolor]|uniref:Uncharacterized protein n=1 Tax=Phyllostomus discolor TaxID=89673 RepID=A0A834EYD6_9CHIR|nr:hypothetical protein HJG60_007963 [Phyllostomus discolor]
MLSRGEGSCSIICGGNFLKWRTLGAAFLCLPNQTSSPSSDLTSSVRPDLGTALPGLCCACEQPRGLCDCVSGTSLFTLSFHSLHCAHPTSHHQCLKGGSIFMCFICQAALSVVYTLRIYFGELSRPHLWIIR